MAELTIPFWLASAEIRDGISVNDWLRSRHIQLRWIDELLQITEKKIPVEGIDPSVPQFIWPAGQITDFYFLQSACREIALGEKRLILILSARHEVTTAVLLAAPAAVGMYNLIPQAYVEDWFYSVLSDPANLFDFLERSLVKVQRKPSEVDDLLLLMDGKRPIKTKTNFEHSAWVKPEEVVSGTLQACHELVQRLIGKKHSNGLAVEVTQDKKCYTAWFERI